MIHVRQFLYTLDKVRGQMNLWFGAIESVERQDVDGSIGCRITIKSTENRHGKDGRAAAVIDMSDHDMLELRNKLTYMIGENAREERKRLAKPKPRR